MSIFDSADRVNAVIQVRRGKDVERQVKRYDAGELIYTTDTKRLFAGDGATDISGGTYGGVIVGNKTWVGTNFANFPSQIGDLVYRNDAAPVGTGFYLLTGSNYPASDIRNYVLVGGDALLSRVPAYTIKAASYTQLGGVKVNDAPISIDANGFLTLRTDSSLTVDNGVLKVVSVPSTNNNNNNTNTNTNSNSNVICQPTTTTATVPDNVAIGTVLWFTRETVPDTSYMECNGRFLNRSAYSDLFAVIGTKFGVGDGSTTFNIPDLRGEFVRGWDHGKGSDKNDGTPRSFGSSQPESLSAHTHDVHGGGNEGGPFIDTTSAIDYQTVATSPTGGTETRPRNVALLPCIKVIKKDTTLTINTGCVATGKALSMNNGVLDVNVQSNNALKIDSSNNLYIDTTSILNNVTFGKASTLAYGIVKIKDTNSGLDVSNGIIATKIATNSNLGAVAVGDTLDIDSNTGVLNVKGGIPIGTISWFAMSAVPAGWLECDGASVSGTVYPDLSGAIGTKYGVGTNAPYTFNLPDLRGEFVRGWDHGKGVDAGRTFGSKQTDDFKSHTHNATDRGDDGNGSGLGVGGTGYNASIGAGSINLANTGGTETRPRNVALMPCIYAFNANLTQTTIDVGALAATKADKTSFNALLSSNGYQILPSGLIMQWGTTPIITGDNSVNVNLPIPFLTQIFNIQATVSGSSAVSSATNAPKVSAVSLSAIKITNDQLYTGGTVISMDYAFCWQAIGY